MEFANVGKHCANPSCKQLDFLPFKCSHCKRCYCIQHRLPKDHTCNKFTPPREEVALVCTDCRRSVLRKIGEDLSLAMRRHYESGECDKKLEKPYKCSYIRATGKRCKNGEYDEIICKHCKKNFCVKHRHPEEHHCKKGKGEKVSPRPRGEIDCPISKAAALDEAKRAGGVNVQIIDYVFDNFGTRVGSGSAMDLPRQALSGANAKAPRGIKFGRPIAIPEALAGDIIHFQSAVFSGGSGDKAYNVQLGYAESKGQHVAIIIGMRNRGNLIHVAHQTANSKTGKILHTKLKLADLQSGSVQAYRPISNKPYIPFNIPGIFSTSSSSRQRKSNPKPRPKPIPRSKFRHRANPKPKSRSQAPTVRSNVNPETVAMQQALAASLRASSGANEDKQLKLALQASRMEAEAKAREDAELAAALEASKETARLEGKRGVDRKRVGNSQSGEEEKCTIM